jgi:SET domain-containing protein
MRSRSGIRVGAAGKLGRGIFATKAFKKGDLIEEAPIIVFSWADSAIIDRTDLSRYVYCFASDSYTDLERVCLGLGYTSLYNHSTRPNAVYTVKQDRIEIRALRTIKAGAQIKINYNGDPKDKTPWEFEESA